MREILFRGKRTTNGEWVYGSLIQTKDSASIWSEELKDDVEVDPKTVGQWTGFRDKHNKRIFEGDIVSIQNKAEKKRSKGYVELSKRGFWAFLPLDRNDFFYATESLADIEAELDLYILMYDEDYGDIIKEDYNG